MAIWQMGNRAIGQWDKWVMGQMGNGAGAKLNYIIFD